jgi:hypothetical protein
MQLVTPLFLDWSEVAITFDRDDHPDYVPNLRVYPLIVDLIIANTASPRCSWTEAAVSTSFTPRPSTF